MSDESRGVTRADVLAAWFRAIVEQPGCASWNDREAAVSPAFTTESLGRLCEIAQELQSDAHRALERRMESMGHRVSVRGRDVEVRTRLPWFIAVPPWRHDGVAHLFWCIEDEPSEWGEDWYSDPVDDTEFRPLPLAGEDLSAVLMGGDGITLVTTSKRVEPRVLRSRR